MVRVATAVRIRLITVTVKLKIQEMTTKMETTLETDDKHFLNGAKIDQ